MQCNKCEAYFDALGGVLANDPSLRRAVTTLWWKNGTAHREFMLECHALPRYEKVQKIKTVLQIEQSRPTVHSSEDEQAIAEIVRSYDKHDRKRTQEHFHCHSIARYNPSMPHSDSARYRPSSHVPPVRSNPLPFFNPQGEV